MAFSEFIHDCNINENINITNAICSSSDSILAEYVKRPYRTDSLKLLFSMTKAFSSLAIGIAMDLGLLAVDDYIVEYFEDDLPQTSDKHLSKISIRHLLTMSSGIHENTYADLFVQRNWIKAFLQQNFPREPGTYYRYSTHSSHMLSAIITKVSSLSLDAFLNKYLFYPMEIYEANWEKSPEGLTSGGMGLSLYPRSLVKVSQLLLNRGIYNGKRLISQKYIEMATKQQIIKQDDVNKPDTTFSGTGYGFQFHIGKDNFYRFDGAFGQLCLICPNKNLSVIVFSQYSKMETLLSLIYKHLLEEPLVCDDIAIMQEAPSLLPNNSSRIPCKKYNLSQNDLGVESIEFIQENEDYKLILSDKEHTNTIKFSFSEKTEGQMYFIKDLQEHLQDYVCIAEFNKTLKLKVFLIETPYVVTYHFIFNENEVQFDFLINVSFTLHNHSIRGFYSEANEHALPVKWQS